MISNFYHIREKNVFLETKLDSKAKHKRNLVLATWVIVSIILFPFGLPNLCAEIHRELCIREINKKYPKMPYHKCVHLVGLNVESGVMHEGQLVKNPIDLKDPIQKKRFRITKIVADISMVALVLLAIAGAIIIGI
jgi:hypothetical protein